MKSRSYRIGGIGRRAIVAGLTLSALVSAPALAQQNQPFKSVDFGAPTAAATESAAAAQAPAAPAEPGYVTFFKSIEFGGLVDAYYEYNGTKMPAKYRAFDTQQNSFTPSMVEVWFNKAPTADSRAGFKLKTIFGPAATTINFNEPNAALVNVLEAYVSYLAPVGSGLQFDFGKFVTPAGAEVIEAKDDWNYSRGLLFQNAIPYYHAGVRALYTVNDQISISGYLVNGWNNTNDSNTGKSMIGTITWKPTAALAISENYITGPEAPGTNSGWRRMSDTVLTYTINSTMSVIGNYDYGHDSNPSPSVSWQGIAGYFKYQATPMIAIVPRVEYFNDTNGFTTGVVQKLTDFTLTAEVKPVDNLVFRIEYRGDYSNVSGSAIPPPFVNDTGSGKSSQNSFIFGALYSFTTK